MAMVIKQKNSYLAYEFWNQNKIISFFLLDLEARPWDFQDEECALRSCVDQFNNRRYLNVLKDEELAPLDTSVMSALGMNIELTEEFKHHYELWLQQEVFQTSIDWDGLFGYTKNTCEL